MLGAIAGDIIGSVYEHRPIKSKDFPLFHKNSCFTDDTVLTVAVAESIMEKTGYQEKIQEYFHLYPKAGYGGYFIRWALSTSHRPYNSWGNGSAMRVSPVGYAFDSLDKVLAESKKSAEITHNHPEGIKGAQAVAAAIFLAKKGDDKDQIKKFIEENFGYGLSQSIESIRGNYGFDVSCPGSVPQAITAFLESRDYEDAIRNAISLGGDSDTLACMAGAIAEAYYRGIPAIIEKKAMSYLDGSLSRVVRKFRSRYI